MGTGRNKWEREKRDRSSAIKQTCWCGPSEIFEITWISQVMPRISFLKVSGGPACALGKEQRPKHGHGWAFHWKRVSCFGAEMGSTCRRDLVSISPLFMAQLSHHGLYPFVLVLWGSLSALLHFLLTWAMNPCVSPCHGQAVHISFGCVFTKCALQNLAGPEKGVCK